MVGMKELKIQESIIVFLKKTKIHVELRTEEEKMVAVWVFGAPWHPSPRQYRSVYSALGLVSLQKSCFFGSEFQGGKVNSKKIFFDI
jgi:hypothetical protein